MKILIVDDVKGWRDYHARFVNYLFPQCNIVFAESAREAYDKLLENNNDPFDIILTDLQMENDFEPKYAGEWFVEQIQIFRNYYKTRVFIISASYNVNVIAENLGVDYIRKSTAQNFPDVYEKLKN